MAEPIEIIIRQGGQGGTGFGSGTGGAVNGSSGASKDSKSENKTILKSIISNQYVGFVKNQVKSAIMYSLNNFGNMTGDYIGQTEIGQALSIVSDLSSVVMGAYVGGAPGAILAIGNIAFNKGQQMFNGYIEITKQNTQASYMRERSGNSLNNGSSGTYE